MEVSESTKNQYADEVKQRWGSTAAYKENQKKSSFMSKEEKEQATAILEGIMAEFSTAMKEDLPPESDEAQLLCKKLQEHITKSFYTCTKEILRGLGEMYVLDERFRSNIDKNKEGTAEFIRQSIAIYCK